MKRKRRCSQKGWPVKPHRIVLAKNARFLSETFKRIIRKTDGIEVVGETADLRLLPSVAEAKKAEWVILFRPLTASLPAILTSLFSAAHSVRVLVVARDGSEITMHWMTAHEQVMQIMPISTQEELIDLIRSLT
jgi:DNA-binding NarL/FixJ family response regulator